MDLPTDNQAPPMGSMESGFFEDFASRGMVDMLENPGFGDELHHLCKELDQSQAQLDQMQSRLNKSQNLIQQASETNTQLQARIVVLEKTVSRQRAAIEFQNVIIQGPRFKPHPPPHNMDTHPMAPVPQAPGMMQQQTQNVAQPSHPSNSTVQPHISERSPPRFNINLANTSSRAPVPSTSQVEQSVYYNNPSGFDPSVYRILLQNTAPPTTTVPRPNANWRVPQTPQAQQNAPMAPVTRSGPAELAQINELLANRFEILWTRTEAFARIHASMPGATNRQPGKPVMDYIARASDETIASALLSNDTTRYHIVAKVVNFFITNEILRIEAAWGFDANMDSMIDNFKHQCSIINPPMTRQRTFMRMASKLRMIKTNSKFSDFCLKRVQDHLLRIEQIVAPLVHERSNCDRTELTIILIEAQELAIDLYSMPFEYELNFPLMNSPFDPHNMVNRDPALVGDPHTLSNWGARVRLAVTPVVRVCISNIPDNIGVRQPVAMANVLLLPLLTPQQFAPATVTEDQSVMT